MKKLFVLFFFLVLFSKIVSAAPGDIVFRDTGNSTITTYWSNNTGQYSYVRGFLTFDGSSATQYTIHSKPHNLGLTSGTYELIFEMNDSGASWVSQFQMFGVSNASKTVSILSNAEYMVGLETGNCNQATIVYRAFSEGTGCPSVADTSRTTGLHNWSVVYNLTLGKAILKKSGVNFANKTLPASFNIEHITFYSRTFKEYSFRNITLCDTTCSPVATNEIPTITQSTYNHSTAINAANETAWRTATNITSHTTDLTPTIRFDTDVTAWCRIGVTNANWSTMGDTRNCATTNSTSHVCTVIAGDAYSQGQGDVPVYLGCTNTNDFTKENVTSTSGPLNLSIDTIPTGAGVNIVLCPNMTQAIWNANVSRGSYSPKTKRYNETFVLPVNNTVCGYTYKLNNTNTTNSKDVNVTANLTYASRNISFYYLTNIFNTTPYTITLSPSEVLYINISMNISNWYVLSVPPAINITVRG